MAAVVSALTGLGGGTDDPATAPTPSATRTASVRIQYPQQAASVRQHQKVSGVAVIPPHHSLWLVAHKKGEANLYLLGRAHLTGQA